ncbi:PTS galactitol transporter subunit IIC [Pectinatus sottacetonis]|uniref:PTS galactitol transporter subunit IIC n=1 Tax=Pectinatus sottacetonis TaxID=1002795 RepID=UPI0018C7BC11|nr:PTS galactitol transporter subunit IIC [Pectinatus sottacetonis]
MNFSLFLLDTVKYILSFGPTVMLPLVLFILAMFFRIPISIALRSSLTVGMGFVGIYAIFGILTNNIGPAAQSMVTHSGINLPIVDLGWPPLAAITWGSPIAAFVIPLTILINIALLAFNLTRTVDVDMWNYWHFALAGALVYYSTDSFLLGLLAAGITAIVIFKLADWSAPLVEKYFGLEGISLPTLSSAVFFPIGLLGDKIIDKIPVINKIHIDPQSIQKKFGVFGEPMLIGIILGIMVGILAGYNFKNTLILGINIGAVMFILPRMVKILMEGLLPLSESIKKFLNKKYPNRKDLYIGLDIAVAIGSPAIISTALLLTPLAVIFAFLIPANQVLPLGDLANLAVFASMIVLATKGNIFRAIIISIPCMIGDLLIATNIAPFVTHMAKDVQFNFPPNSSGLVSSFLDGGNPYRFWIMKIFQGNILSIALIPVIAVIIYFIYKWTKGYVYGKNES